MNLPRTGWAYGLTAAAVAAGITGVALLTPAASAAPNASAAAAHHAIDPNAVKPTVVLVHGGFADASSWTGVVKVLQADGFTVDVPANPLRGIGSDADYIHSVLASIQGPIVLVGHSYGGAVITNAVQGNPNVKALVYVAAFQPDTGEQLGQLIQKFPGSKIQAALNAVPYNTGGTSGTDLYLQPSQFHAVFADDLPMGQTNVMAAEQRPFAANCFTDPTTSAAWHTVPSWGVVAGADLAIPPALEQWEYQRSGTHYIVVPGASHVVMMSHPVTVADLIEQAAEATVQ